MKRFLSVCVVLTLLLAALTACTGWDSDWGSFTSDKTYSYDKVYYAEQKVEKLTDVSQITVYIYKADGDEEVFSFSPARASDFWGICWENDSYNIWNQSADIGVICWRYNGVNWEEDKTATRPDYIISKYDKTTTQK